MSVFDKNKLSEEIGDTLSLTTYSRDDFGDLLFLSDGEVLYFNCGELLSISAKYPVSGKQKLVSGRARKGRQAGGNPLIILQDPRKTTSSFHSGSFFISRKLKNLYNPVQENVIMVNLNTAFLDTLIFCPRH